MRGRYPTLKWFWIGAAIYLIVAIPTLYFVPGMLLENWMPDAPIDERNKALGTAGLLVLIALGGVIAVIGVALSLSRHGEELKAATAADERELRARFIAAVDLISDAKSATKRTAGVYALAALADDWMGFSRPDETQVCIDVLCGYLRSPLPNKAPRTPPEEVAVRTSGYALIAAHLQGGHPASWGTYEFNLKGALIDYTVFLDRATINDGGSVSLTGATINDGGSVFLNRGTINDGGSVSLDGATINDGGYVSLIAATINDGGRVFLTGATINGGRMSLTGATFIGGSVFLNEATINGGGSVSLRGMTIDGGSVVLDDATINGGGSVSLNEATINGGSVSLPGATINGGGSLSLDGATIKDGGPITLPDGRALVPAQRGAG